MSRNHSMGKTSTRVEIWWVKLKLREFTHKYEVCLSSLLFICRTVYIIVPLSWNLSCLLHLFSFLLPINWSSIQLLICRCCCYLGWKCCCTSWKCFCWCFSHSCWCPCVYYCWWWCHWWCIRRCKHWKHYHNLLHRSMSKI